jgi:arsenate reductase
MTGSSKFYFFAQKIHTAARWLKDGPKKLKADIIEAYYAGIETHGLDLHAVSVIPEAGVDISNYRAKHVDKLKDIDFDYVITVCDYANVHCPVF